ncbi:thioredoxin-dependent thiol peroxidase [Maritimibacter fusiformis]|uniref:thioredoxin-dependent peroxiredoxin n=1 Tax=Maritimibacter fusiformis TaxID=2603819 RepID=A0A5D0RIZ1_9RHOB|nr:thioredoxin-dependent thiol peroxidase [Maritimibacter fusiformis]TYB81600.1 thioredoxin-dependent thiol peroxidase [Maritimibacter fusiformis]
MTDAALQLGTKAPDFTLPRDGGGSVTLSDLRAGPVVLFFYPKANTPGCTTEARDFTALLPEFESAGATVLGISKDSVKKQENFVSKQDLGMPILSDAEGEVCETYGVWAEKKMYGKTFMGIQRTTVLIDAEGRIARVWEKVKVAGHAEEVLDAVRAL